MGGGGAQDGDPSHLPPSTRCGFRGKSGGFGKAANLHVTVTVM
jgi:hypothetical protein